MLGITEQVQKLIEEGSTEEALETFANWLRTEQSYALNEVILLRSRYEQVEKELGLDLISSEDATRAYSQINYALLNLVQNVNTGKPDVNKQVVPNRRGWLIAGAGALLILVLLMFVLKVLFPSRVLPDTSQSEKTETVQKGTALQFPQGKEVALTSMGTQVTFTVITGRTEPYNPENQKITLKIRCFLHEGRGGMNFWESSFRLLVNEMPYAAQGGLNEVVENESFKDGEVYFLIPTAVRKADLKITFYEEYTVVPLQW